MKLKIFILGLDGLEYNLVKKWDLQNLKQKEYCKISVPITEKRGVPLSPEVWASFLTGKQILGLEFVRPGSTGKIMKFLMFLRRHIPLSLGIGRRVRHKAPRTFPQLKLSTFIDKPGVSEINAPYYSYDHTVFSTIQRFGNDEISMQQAVNELLAIYKKRKKQILSEIEIKLKSSNVVFAFANFPDSIQHFLFMRPQSIKKLYIDLDNFVLSLKRIVKDEGFVIISDHGFDLKKGMHSLYGFYSSNMIINPKPKRITDFYNIILESCPILEHNTS